MLSLDDSHPSSTQPDKSIHSTTMSEFSATVNMILIRLKHDERPIQIPSTNVYIFTHFNIPNYFRKLIISTSYMKMEQFLLFERLARQKYTWGSRCVLSRSSHRAVRDLERVLILSMCTRKCYVYDNRLARACKLCYYNATGR